MVKGVADDFVKTNEITQVFHVSLHAVANFVRKLMESLSLS